MSDEIDNFLKGLNRFDMEFGKSITLLSNTCVQCLQEKRERKVVACKIPLDLEEFGKFDYVNVPICTDCQGPVSYNMILEFLDIAEILTV